MSALDGVHVRAIDRDLTAARIRVVAELEEAGRLVLAVVPYTTKAGQAALLVISQERTP